MMSTCKFFKYFKLHTRYELNIWCLWKIYFCLFRIPKYTLNNLALTLLSFYDDSSMELTFVIFIVIS